MKQFFAPYWDWEDFKNGMYNKQTKNELEHIEKSIEILSDSELFFKISKQMIAEWIISAKVNLTDLQQNRRAWIGQATCCFANGTPENLVRIAWNSLSEQKQKEANYIAERIIIEFELKEKNLNYAESLF